MRKTLSYTLAAMMMAFVCPQGLQAQTYQAPKVEISKEKVRYKGNVYYSHIVLEKQTLYSICKAYKVTEQEIYDTNPTLNLQTEGLKKNQILLIPIKEGAGEYDEGNGQAKESESTAPEVQSREEETLVEPSDKDYFFHKVKWYEDLTSIARKYQVSEQAIMNINGLTSRKLARRQMLRVPKDPAKWESAAPLASPEQGSAKPEDGTSGTGQEEREDKNEEKPSILDFFKKPDNKVSASILLPFSASESSRQLVLDFYGGALMAARDLGKEGIEIELNAFDSGKTSGSLSSSDFVLGPISKNDIARTAKSGETWVISPIDRNVASLADSVANVIQAPTSIECQVEDAAKWLKEEAQPGDNIVLITQKGGKGDYASTLTKAMEKTGLSYTTLSLSVFEAEKLSSSLANRLGEGGVTRIITTSESESFTSQLVKSLYILACSGHDITLYSNARIRTFNTIETQQLHGLNLHVSAATEVDYASEEVRAFTLAYRALYGAEPSHFAFQGYDLMRQFSLLAAKHGSRWHEAIDEVRIKGLQADFDYVKNPHGGYSNTATRRVVYSPDYSINVVE